MLNLVIHLIQGYVLLVPKGHPPGTSGINRRCRQALADERRTHGLDYFEVLQQKCKGAGEHATAVSQLSRSSDGPLAMKNGNADTLIVGTSPAVDRVKSADEGASLEIVAPEGKLFRGDPQHIGIGLTKADPELIEAAEAGMAAQQKDGTLKKPFYTFGLGDDEIPQILVNAPYSESLA